MKLMYFLKHKEIKYATLFSNKPISPFQVPFVLSPIELSGEFIKMYLNKIYYTKFELYSSCNLYTLGLDCWQWL